MSGSVRVRGWTERSNAEWGGGGDARRHRGTRRDHAQGLGGFPGRWKLNDEEARLMDAVVAYRSRSETTYDPSPPIPSIQETGAPVWISKADPEERDPVIPETVQM